MKAPPTSIELADEFCELYNLIGLSHEERVHRIQGLILRYQAIRDYGELEHTSDWDWRIQVAYAGDGGDTSFAGTYQNGEDDDSWSDLMKLDYTCIPNDYLDRFARWQYLTVEETHSSDDTEDYDPAWVRVPVDSILSIEFFREG